MKEENNYGRSQKRVYNDESRSSTWNGSWRHGQDRPVKLVDALISGETLDTDELEALFKQEKLPPKLVQVKPPEPKQREAKTPQPAPSMLRLQSQ